MNRSRLLWLTWFRCGVLLLTTWTATLLVCLLLQTFKDSAVRVLAVTEHPVNPELSTEERLSLLDDVAHRVCALNFDERRVFWADARKDPLLLSLTAGELRYLTARLVRPSLRPLVSAFNALTPQERGVLCERLMDANVARDPGLLPVRELFEQPSVRDKLIRDGLPSDIFERDASMVLMMIPFLEQAEEALKRGI